MINSNNIQQAVPSVVDIIYDNLKDLNNSSTKQDIVEKLNEISFLKDLDENTKATINTFADKILARMGNRNTPQQAFEIIKAYEPDFFWRVIYWFASILNIDTEKSVFERMINKSNELYTNERVLDELSNKINTNERVLDSSDEKDNLNQINSIEINTNECVLSPEDIAINNLFRKYLLINGSDWTVLHDQINKGVNPINKMADPQQNQFFVKELTANNGKYKPTEEVSRAAMMHWYLGENKSTEYMIIHKDNKQYVASKAVPDSMTLYQYIFSELKIDQEEFQEFKEKFKDQYLTPTLEKNKEGYNLIQKIQMYNEVHAQEIGYSLYEVITTLKKSKDFWIKELIEDLNSCDYFRNQNPLEAKYKDIYCLISKECDLKQEEKLTDEDKENIRKFCNDNLNILLVGIVCTDQIKQFKKRDYYKSIQILEALGGLDSPLVEEYIKLQQANFAVGNNDGHYDNILVKLDAQGKAQGLVAIDFDNTDSPTGLGQYDNLKKVLNHYRPGMVQRIEEEFKQSMQQPRKLHDLAKLLGAKEEEYRMLNNIEVSSTKFQDMINRAMNEGAVLNR